MPSKNTRKAASIRQKFETQLQATLNIIPAYTCYAAPSGALTFVNERCADYLGLPADHPLRLGIPTDAAWDSHVPLLHPDDHEETRRVWSTCLRTGCAGEVSFRVRSAEGSSRCFSAVSNLSGPMMEHCFIGSESTSTLRNENKLSSISRKDNG
jgi:PAS domain-containing protein